jgi:NTP pyrophosphatase (non-canonical NTP hydrolase)
MTAIEYLLITLAEECLEVAHRCSKALRFGLDDVEPGEEETNREKIAQELDDVAGAADELRDRGVLRDRSVGAITRKREKIKKMMEYSRGRGTLDIGK